MPMCEYCEERETTWANEFAEAVCDLCQFEHDTRDLCEAEPCYDPATQEQTVFVAFNTEWCENGDGVQSAPLTIEQARLVVKSIEDAIKWLEDRRAED